MMKLKFVVLMLIIFSAPLSANYLFSAAVVAAQNSLKEKNYYSGQVDGIYGKNTVTAVIKFQHRMRLPETGDLDFATRSSLLQPGLYFDLSEYTEDQIAWIENNTLRSTKENPSSLEFAIMRDHALLGFLRKEKYEALKLDVIKSNHYADINLLTVTDKIKNQLHFAVDSIQLQSAWDQSYESNFYAQYYFLGYPCTGTCTGHFAGYEWASVNAIVHSADCSNHSSSFKRGCNLYLNSD